MKVAEIEEISKSRSRVRLDDGTAFVLYKGELRAYHICAGEELSEADSRAIMGGVLQKRAKRRALNLLAKRDYTERQLYDKLKAGEYPEQMIREALAYVASFHYTDDLRYAASYIAGHADSRSRRRIERDLLNKGIGKQTLEQAWREWEEEGGSQDEQGMIGELLQKRGFDPCTADAGERRRTYDFLLRKGFSGEAVCRALRLGDLEASLSEGRFSCV